MANQHDIPNRAIICNERRSRALAALIASSGATQLEELDLSNPLIASSSIGELRAQLEIATREKGILLSKAFQKILSPRTTLAFGKGQKWEKVDDVRWVGLRYKLVVYRLSGLLYSEVDVFQVNFTKDTELPESPLQYHIASLVTKSSLGYFTSKSENRASSRFFTVDKILDLDKKKFPANRSHIGSMNRARETLRTWPKRQALTGDELEIHNKIIRLILDDY